MMSDEADAEQAAAERARQAVAAAEPALPTILTQLTAMADPTRLELLIAIDAIPDAPVKTLAAAIARSPNTVTQALAALADAGLVQKTRDGRLSRWHLTDTARLDLRHHLGQAPSHPD